MRNLLIGLIEWRLRVRPHLKDALAKLANEQRPNVLFIGCSDSRVAVNVFASTRPGDTYVIRNVGNLVPPSRAPEIHRDLEKGFVGSAVEFGIHSFNVKNIIVCGHSGCGAVHALTKLNDLHPNECDLGKHTGDDMKWAKSAHQHKQKEADSHKHVVCQHSNESIPVIPEMPSMTSWLRWGHPTAAAWKAGERIDGSQRLSLTDQLSQLNVKQQLAHLETYEIVQKRLAAKELHVHGWWFDIGAAAVYAFNKETNRFRLIDLSEANRIMENMGEPPINKDLMDAMRGHLHDYETLLETA